MASGSHRFEPGDEIIIVGLMGAGHLNGEHGVVRPIEEWPGREGRVAVQVLTKPPQTLAVKAQNIQPRPPACFICLEGDVDQALLQPGCGCRGSSGSVHEHCAIQAAAAQQASAGTWTGKHPWQLCAVCRLPYTGPLKLALAQEWCRRTEPLAATDTQRFAARTTLGNALSALGRLGEAETVVRANLETCTVVHGGEHRHTLGTTLNLGLLLDGQGKHAEAAGVYSDLVETQTRVLGAEHRDTLATAMQLAGAALNQGRAAEAEERYRAILEVQARVLGPADPATLTCGMNYGSALLNLARYAEAEATYRANLDAKRRKLGPEHIDTLMAEMNLGLVYKERGRYADAEECLAENLAVKRRVLGPSHADTCFAALNLVSVWIDGEMEARYDEAARTVVHAQVALRRALGEEHPSVLSAAMHHALVMHAQGATPLAVEKLRGVHAAQERVHGKRDHPDVLETGWRLGAMLGVAEPPAGDAPAAAALLHTVAEYHSAQLGGSHPRTLRTLVSRGEALMATGDDEDASEAARVLAECEVSQRAVLEPSHPDLLKCRRLLERTRQRPAVAVDVL